MEPDQTPINSAPARRRSLRARIEDVALAVESGVLWRLGDAVKALFAVLLWPFERLLWVLQRWLVWPLQDRAAGFGRVLAVAASVLLIAAIGAGAFLLATSKRSTAPAATQVVVVDETAAKTPPPAEPRKPAPTLHGAAPVFKPATGKDSSKVGSAKSVEADASPSESSAATSSSPATDKISSDPTPSRPTSSTSSADATAETSAIPGPAAGAKAIAVAREFSGAFVVYETGGEKSTVRKGFAATTTPDLAKALLKRPPRLPADVTVPKAKIVNIVPGPSQGSVYTVSVSLLRVGVTSELRLEMEKVKDEGWRVTNVLG